MRPSLLGAEFVGAKLVRGRLCQGPSWLGTELSRILLYYFASLSEYVSAFQLLFPRNLSVHR